ncbi:substrate-binding domain-containing protein [Ralstonia sp. SET104]|uniref:substrate-binding domain-containing protein n=1 Tax=Ralstonia sp. SET104 TaxID=2448774 RepID=UPI000F570230|nr:substrate-binding domain-containing protein [Ralstonia sp. SET104]GCB06033.1 solute-binding periplasmic protein [Ralstonia sp. SET104]
MLPLPRLLRFTALALSALSVGFLPAAARADEVRVMNSGGFTAAYKSLAPAFERATGNTLVTAWGPSMGASPEAIPNRLARGEQADVLIMVGEALNGLIQKGIVDRASRVDLAESRIGMVVRAGAPKPDISTEDALRNTLLQAKSVAYSDSASGVYIETTLFKRLGIEDQMRGKAHKIEKTPVASLVATGDYAIGFQQVSELLPVPGVDFVGKIPESLQKVTVFSAGIPVGAAHPKAAHELIRYLASPAAAPTVQQSGMEPARASARAPEPAQ